MPLRFNLNSSRFRSRRLPKITAALLLCRLSAYIRRRARELTSGFHGTATALATFGQHRASWHSDCTFWRRRHAADREQLMSTFDNPFDPDHSLRSSGCSCGRHVSEAEHQAAAQLQIQACLEGEQKRYEGVVASAVMRAMFPH